MSRARPNPPIIHSPWGPVTEWARQQAAVNQRDNPVLREQIIAMIAIERSLSYEAALAEHKRRYPEAWGL